MPRRSFANRGTARKKAERQEKLNTLQGLVNRRNQIMMAANEAAHNRGISAYVQPSQIAFQDIKAQIETDKDLDEQIAIYRAAVEAPLSYTETDKFVTPTPYMLELEVRTKVANRRAKTEFEYAKRHNKEVIKDSEGNVLSTVKLIGRLPEQKVHAKELSDYTLEGFRKHADALQYRTTGTGSTERWITYQKNYIKGVNVLLDQYMDGEQGLPDLEKQAVVVAFRNALLELDPREFRRVYYSKITGDIDYLQSEDEHSAEEIEDKIRTISRMYNLGLFDKNGNVNNKNVQKYLKRG